MVKIGEVEFLVKFDTIGKQFKEILKESLKDLDVGEDVDDRLANIEGYLGLLVTPFSGNRIVDLRKVGAHLKQLENEDWIEGKVKAIASNETLLKKYGLEGLELGTKETEEAVRPMFLALTRDIAKYMKVTLSSEFAYMKGLPTLIDIVALLSTSTEGNLAYLMETLMKKVQVEAHVDKAVFDWLEDEIGATTIRQQRYWETIQEDIVKAGKEPGIETYQELMDEFGRILKDNPNKVQLLKDMFEHDAKRFTKEEQIEFVRKLVEKGIAAGLALPKAFMRTIEYLLPEREKNISAKFAVDLKFILTEISQIPDVIDKMGLAIKDEDKEWLSDRMEKHIQKYGLYFGYGESALTGGTQKRIRDLARLPPSQRREFFTATYTGGQYGNFMEEVASRIPIGEIVDEMEERLPKQVVSQLKKEFDTLKKIEGYISSNPDVFANKIRGDLEEFMKQIGRIHNG